MTIDDVLSGKGISALMEATEIGKDKFNEKFRSATVTKLLKNGFWAEIETTDGYIHRISVRKKGSATIISMLSRRGI